MSDAGPGKTSKTNIEMGKKVKKMKKIINGISYDTDTADEVVYHSHGHRSDFHYIEEILYRTKKGNFFLVGKGGASTRYARTVSQNCWCGGTGWEILSTREALAFCESHGDVEIIEKYFSVEEG